MSTLTSASKDRDQEQAKSSTNKLTPAAFCTAVLTQRGRQNWGEASGNNGGCGDQCHICLTLSQHSLLLGNRTKRHEKLKGNQTQRTGVKTFTCQSFGKVSPSGQNCPGSPSAHSWRYFQISFFSLDSFNSSMCFEQLPRYMW